MRKSVCILLLSALLPLVAPALPIKIPFLTKPVEKMSIEELERRVERNPNDLKARIRLAELYYEKGELEKAAGQFEKAYRINPHDRSVVENLASTYEMISLTAQANRDFKKAMEYALKLRQIESKTGLIGFRGEYQMALTLAKEGKRDQAFKLAEAILRVAPNHRNAISLAVTILAEQARESLRRDKPMMAVEKLRKIVRITGDDSFRLQIARILLANGEREEALKELKSVEKNRLLARDDEVQYRLGMLYGKLGDYDAQSLHLLNISPGSPRYKEAQSVLERNYRMTSLMVKARDAIKAGRIEEAVDILKEITSILPEHVAAKLLLVKLLAGEGRREEAKDVLDDLCSLPERLFDEKIAQEIRDLYAELSPPKPSKPTTAEVKPEVVTVEPSPPQETSSKPKPPETSPPSSPAVAASKPAGSETAESSPPPQETPSKPKPPETSPPSSSAIAPPKPAESEGIPIDPIERRIRGIVRENGVELALALALVKMESNMNPFAVSKAGAAGLCQLMPTTARELGLKVPKYPNPRRPTRDPKVDERFDPEKSFEAGMRYLGKMLRRYNDNPPLALSAYNAGAGRTKRRVARIPETTAYVADIMTYYYMYNSDQDEMRKALNALIAAFKKGGSR